MDVKTVYAADIRELAEQNLFLLDEKWGQKYPLVLKSWQKGKVERSHHSDNTEFYQLIEYKEDVDLKAKLSG